MIQYPINVSYQNQTYDATAILNPEFTFLGDKLSYVYSIVRDYDTNDMIRDFFYNFTNNPYYNGEEVMLGGMATTLRSLLTNGRRYTLQMMFSQRNSNNSEFVSDMFVLGGQVEGSVSRTQIYVEPNINTIYPWGKLNGVYTRNTYNDTPICNMVLRINNESHNILSYTEEVTVGDKTYGLIVVDSAFSFDITEDMEYYVYSSYIITPQYYFECSATPTVTLTNTITGYPSLVCNGTYNQAQNRYIKYYRLKLYWANNEYFSDNSSYNKCILIEDTGDIYSNEIHYEFLNCFRHDPYNLAGTTDYYKVTCELVTQDNLKAVVDSDTLQRDAVDRSADDINRFWGLEARYAAIHGCTVLKLRGYGSVNSQTAHYTDGLGGAKHLLIRETLGYENGQEVIYDSVYLDGRAYWLNFDFGIAYIRDETVPNRGKFRYRLVNFTELTGQVFMPTKSDGSGLMTEFPSCEIEINEYAYYITELNEIGNPAWEMNPNYHKTAHTRYECGKTWKFIGEVQNTTVTNNLNRVNHIGYGRYTSATSTETNYMSGTLTAMLGNILCTDYDFKDNPQGLMWDEEGREFRDDIELVKEWRAFITQPKPFMLKSQKGDVWIVNIVDNPNTEYDDSNYSLMTTISFSWAECDSITTADINNNNVT